jgi:YD repeat-containing protein
VSARGNWVAATKSDGTLWGWGWNGYGQLGQEDIIDRSSPVQVGSDTNWSLVSCGNFDILSIKSDGTLWAWGRNLYGTHGQGDLISRSSPVQVGSDTNWSSVEVTVFTLAIK